MTDAAPIRLLIATHTHGALTPAYTQSLANLCSFLGLNGMAASVMLFEDSLVDRGRDRAAAVVMENSDITHLLFIDADIQFQPADVLRLVAGGKDLSVAAYRKKNDRNEYAIAWLPNADREPVQQCPETGFVRIARAGTGFMLIARSVFERIAATRPDIEYDDVSSVAGVRTMHAFFEHYRRGRQRFSEDFEFCERWAEAGGEIWMDPEITLGHWGPHCWRGSILDHFVTADAESNRSVKEN